MNDDWRLQLQAADEGEALLLVERLGGPGPGHTLGTAFDDKVIVSREGAQVFLYAATREQVEAAGELAAKLAGENEWQVSSSLSRWHHESERWEDPDEPLPASAAERQAEHEELVSEERAEVAAGATPQWEVRVDLPSHGDARRFAEQLESEGIPRVRRWKYLVVGAADEDTARALASRLEAEAPAGSEVTVEGNERAVYEEQPPNPFAIFGGLGG
ncbi:MAG: hypothetical protein U0R71_13845 [Solirubrobacterales bacterium]